VIGDLGVGLAEEFRNNAQQCFKWAREARSIESQTYWLDMAQLWLRLAQHAEEREWRTDAAPSRPAGKSGNGHEESQS
jgi:hypothetical protein